ncbi:MAG: hypothetical protein ACR2PO_17780 [Methyloligellaceae bacterium]
MRKHMRAVGRALALIGLIVVPVWALLLGFAVWSDPTSVRAWVKLVGAIGIWFWLYEDVYLQPADRDPEADAEPAPQSAKTDISR